ncbi:MAG: ATP-dependent DNA helicase PcrA [Gemmatimonadaceae bacterium]|nr:ATP-dependent DNA helicase PcrA [Gemmatimonadaceae bacterium]
MTDVLPHEALLRGLNPAQREAVTHDGSPLLVLAGAGSGKTRVLTTRIAHLVHVHGVDPAAILSVTFTNKAAGEMRERIADLLGAAPAGMWSGTFHAIGARILRMHAALVGRTSAYTIYDEADTLGAVKRAMDRARVSTKDFAPQAILAVISDCKNGLVSVTDYETVARDTFGKAVVKVYRELDRLLRESNAVSFDDLLLLPVQMLGGHPDLLERYRRRFRYVLVDEYQDTNRAQYRLVALLGGAHGHVTVVGDDDQSIYGWRGADIRNILDFEQDFPGAAVVRLEENYRSTPEILRLANAAISVNVGRRGKTLRPTRAAGEPVRVLATLDERDEADVVIDDIQARRFEGRGKSLGNFAILYRTNAQSRALEEALRRHAVPYRLIGATRFYDRREIRDLMSYLKLIANPRDDEAFRRAIAVPRRGIGETTLETLGGLAAAQGIPLLVAGTRGDVVGGMRAATRSALAEFSTLIESLRVRAGEAPVDALLQELVLAIGYDDYLATEGPEAADRIANVRELIASAAETVHDEGGEIGLTPLDHFLQRVTLVAAVDGLDPDAEAVTLMTLHNAKGLEFPVVYLTGLEDGLFPLARARDEPALMEEERRLFYVGVTRAEESLTLSWAQMRRRNGELLPSVVSQFLKDLPPASYERRTSPRARASGRPLEARAATRRPGFAVERPSASAFPPEEESQDAPRLVKGARVKHARFGAGTIAELTGTGRETKVTVDFDDDSVGRKRLVVAYAGLEKEWE